jgi:thiol-disulfide isomerase/thioredoxin
MLLRLLIAALAIFVTYEAIELWRRPSHKLTRLDLPELGVRGPAIVQFSTPFCAPCKVAKPHLVEAADKADITYAQIDVQDRPDVGAKYGIRSVPTIVVTDGAGLVLGKWNRLPANSEIHKAAELARSASRTG